MKNFSSNPRKTSSNAFSAATVVTVLSVAERALGFLYRIVLSRLLGAEGLGLYQTALSLFAVFLTIGTGGIPITVSRLISKSRAENNPQGERSATAAGLLLSLLLTLPVCLLLLLFAQKIPFLFSDNRAVSVFKILLLGLVFSSLYAVFRGSFWGNKEFLLPSVLEIAEESVMVLAGVLLLQNVTGSEMGAQKAAIAVVVSYTFSFTASLICFFARGGKLSRPKPMLKPLFNAALPITTVRASGTLINSAVAVLLPAMLIRAGMRESEAVSLLGIVSGMAMPVLFIPSTVIGSLSLVLVPRLSEDFYKGNTKSLQANLRRGLCAAAYVACFLLPFFYVLGDDLGAIAFSEPLAGEFIRLGSPILLPMSLTLISTGMLNSMGFEKQTFLFHCAGDAAMLFCILFLPAFCGANAYVLGLGAAFTVNAVCNLTFLGKKCPNLYKRRGQGRVHRPFHEIFHGVFKAVFAVLPLSLLGQFLSVICLRFFGELLATLVTAILMTLFTACTYLLLKILPVHEIVKYFKTSRKAKKAVLK